MNTALALEIYRGIWLIQGDSRSFNNVLAEARNVVADPLTRLNTFAIKSVQARGTSKVLADSNGGSTTQNKIAVTSITGVITKTGGASSRGMQEISSEMIAADSDPEVAGHLIKLDTPGGSEAGMRYMKSTIASLKKPVVTFVTRQGMAASAGLGIAVEGDYVMAESEDAELGSHGVMWTTSGVPNGQKDGNGEVTFTVISKGSPDKNKATEQAINNNDTSLMQDKVDELYQTFAARTKAKRPNAKDEQMTGAMYKASEVVGTFIDAIGSESDAINKILELSITNSKFSPENKKTKVTSMKADELKSQFPETYTAIFNAGRDAGQSAESDRVKNWNVFALVDPEAVKKGIESGKDMTMAEQSAFLLKAASADGLKALKQDSPAAVTPPEAVTETVAAATTPVAEADKKEIESIYGRYLKKPENKN